MNFDFYKACDMVYHSILLDKMVKDELAKWTRGWGARLVMLASRKDRHSGTKYNGLSVPKGVSQASMLAPLRIDVFVSELNDGNWFAEDSERGEWLVHSWVGDDIQRDRGRLEKWSERN